MIVRNLNGFPTHSEDPGEFNASGERAQKRAGIHYDEQRHLSELARDRLVLEIGTGLGVSTRALCMTARWVTTIDPDPWVHATIWPELVWGNVTALASADALSEDELFEFVFIDGLHTREQVAADTRLALAHLTPGGTIAWHDWNRPCVRAGALDALPFLVIEDFQRIETPAMIGMVQP